MDIFNRHSVYTDERLAVQVFSDSLVASTMVAERIIALIKDNNSKNQRTVLGLATGKTPLQLYAEIIRLYNTEKVSFKNVVVFNLDEYYGLKENDVNTYKYYMYNNLFKFLDIDIKNCHIPTGDVKVEDINDHCDAYEKMIDEYGGIDIQILGIGGNGHIGFNEPGSSIHSKTRLITLDAQTRKDASRDFGGLGKVPKKAITMGIHTILKAKTIFLLGFGENKADAILKTVEQSITEQTPASFLQTHPKTLLVLDDSAAKYLSRKKNPWKYENMQWDDSLLKKAVSDLAIKLNKAILKLTDSDYNENYLSDLLALYGDSYEINIKVFNLIQHTITGWPGGKPNADDSKRPERATPARKRVIIFSPHPDDDIISMGGTFQRLVDQGHDVHVAYQTSGNIAVSNSEALRFMEYGVDFAKLYLKDSTDLENILLNAKESLKNKKIGEKEAKSFLEVKGLIRRGEARATCHYVGIDDEHIHFLNLPFYETGKIKKHPLSEQDYTIIMDLIDKVNPHQIYAAGDLVDPHGTHKICLDAILESLKRLKKKKSMDECWLWLYKGAWAEWDIHEIQMAVPMSPAQVLQKRYGIFKHQSQKDGVVFQGDDMREFWQRAEDRNSNTANLYRQLGFAEYSAMEAFVRVEY